MKEETIKIKCSKCHKFLGIYRGEKFILTYYGDRSKGAWITCPSCYEKCQMTSTLICNKCGALYDKTVAMPGERCLITDCDGTIVMKVNGDERV
jgi:DNA-directed RNA polymerase subunit RPC12/RpoP